MSPRGAATFCKDLMPSALLVVSIVLTLQSAAAAGTAAATDSSAGNASRPVSVTPPLLAIPATPVSKNVQQRMRACNATADGRKLQAAARETFIKSCMAPHRAHPHSSSGSEPKPNA
jgi:hypothetical protein